MVQLLYGPYGPNEVQPSLKAICYTLKNYVDAIPTEATRNLARRSVASFVTNSADDTQIGTTLFDAIGWRQLADEPWVSPSPSLG
jgi:hypothetical protein